MVHCRAAQLFGSLSKVYPTLADETAHFQLAV